MKSYKNIEFTQTNAISISFFFSSRKEKFNESNNACVQARFIVSENKFQCFFLFSHFSLPIDNRINFIRLNLFESNRISKYNIMITIEIVVITNSVPQACQLILLSDIVSLYFRVNVTKIVYEY